MSLFGRKREGVPLRKNAVDSEIVEVASQNADGAVKVTVERLYTRPFGAPVEVVLRRWKRRQTAYLHWDFKIEGQAHAVELEHGQAFGSRCIRVDGVEVTKGRQLIDMGSTYRFDHLGIKFRLVIISEGLSEWAYHLYLNNSAVESELSHAVDVPVRTEFGEQSRKRGEVIYAFGHGETMSAIDED